MHEARLIIPNPLSQRPPGEIAFLGILAGSPGLDCKPSGNDIGLAVAADPIPLAYCGERCHIVPGRFEFHRNAERSTEMSQLGPGR